MIALANDTKIRFCNAMHQVQVHCGSCHDCRLYLLSGDGDLCETGKDLIAREMAYVNTTPEQQEIRVINDRIATLEKVVTGLCDIHP